MKKMICVSMCLLLVHLLNISAVEAERKRYKPQWMCNDVLHIDSSLYFMSQSPLSSFKGYKTMFPHEVISEAGFGTEFGYRDKNYSAHWLLVDNRLCFIGISFVGAEVGRTKFVYDKENEWDVVEVVIEWKYYDAFEKLLNAKFDTRPIKVYSNVPVCRYGVIWADWMSGTIEIKPRPKYLREFPETMGGEVQRLKLEKGKVVSLKKK